MPPPAGLTPAQKAAGRRFRAACQDAWEQLPPAVLRVPAVLCVLRHKCPGRGGISTSLELKERYRLCPDRLFAWIYREGSCRRCGLTARTPGRLVAADRRPPLKETRMTDHNQQPPPTSALTDPENPREFAGQSAADEPRVREQTPQPGQSESTPGATYDNPNGVNDPVDPQQAQAQAEAERGNPDSNQR